MNSEPLYSIFGTITTLAICLRRRLSGNGGTAERQMSKPGQFLITLSGARPEILALCPGERIRFQSIGWAILITSGMAVVSMWFALTTALGVHPYAALPIALLWGLVIMGID